MNNTLINITLLSALCVSCSQGVDDTVLYIKNEDKNKIDLVISPVGNYATPDSTEIREFIKPNEEIVVTLGRRRLDNAKAFSVKGSVKVSSPDSKCGPLQFDHNYKIVFVSGKEGTIVCKYDVLPDK